MVLLLFFIHNSLESFQYHAVAEISKENLWHNAVQANQCLSLFWGNFILQTY